MAEFSAFDSFGELVQDLKLRADDIESLLVSKKPVDLRVGEGVKLP